MLVQQTKLLVLCHFMNTLALVVESENCSLGQLVQIQNKNILPDPQTHLISQN